MKNIIKSGTKLSLILVIACASIAFLASVFYNLHSESVTSAVLNLFGTIATLIVGFYFGKNSKNDSDLEVPQK